MCVCDCGLVWWNYCCVWIWDVMGGIGVVVVCVYCVYLFVVDVCEWYGVVCVGVVGRLCEIVCIEWWVYCVVVLLYGVVDGCVCMWLGGWVGLCGFVVEFVVFDGVWVDGVCVVGCDFWVL